MVNQTNVFDIYDVFVNELVGDLFLFLFLGLIFIWIASVKAKMPYQLSILFGVLWISVMFSVAYDTLIIFWVYAVLGIGTFLYFRISRAIGRG